VDSTRDSGSLSVGSNPAEGVSSENLLRNAAGFFVSRIYINQQADSMIDCWRNNLLF
jgi:hypothetical protein